MDQPLQLINFDIRGMTCAVCKNSVEKALANVNGVYSAEVNFVLNRASVHFNPEFTNSSQLLSAIEDAGFSAQRLRRDDDFAKVYENFEEEYLKLLSRMKYSLVFSVPLVFLAMAPMLGFSLPVLLSPKTEPLNYGIVQLLLVLPVLWAGRDFYIKGVSAFFHWSPNMDTLIAIGTSAAVGLSIWNLAGLGQNIEGLYFETAGVIISLILLGKTLESKSHNRASESINSLLQLRPTEAVLIHDGKVSNIPIDHVCSGDILRIRPGSNIPVDGVIVEGASYVDESMLTGEAVPVKKTIGAEVTGGTSNINGVMDIKVKRVGKKTILSSIIRMVENAQVAKAPVSRMADKVSGVFVPIVITIAIFSGVMWGLSGAETNDILRYTIAVLVIACPCALGLATPIAILVGTGIGARNGILFRNAMALEGAHNLDTIFMDKTGTLTEGSPKVTKLLTNEGVEKELLLQYASFVEQGSEHPIGKAIVAKAEKYNFENSEISGFESISGLGVKAKVNGSPIIIGNQTLMQSENIIFDTRSEIVKQIPFGSTSVYVGIDGKLAGIICLEDMARPESMLAVDKLRLMGLEVVMLTGDHQNSAYAVSQKTGITNFRYGVRPEEKSKIIKEYQQKGCRVGMIGDGINDAPALSQAEVGISMGSGIDVALETSDVVLMKNDLRHVVIAIQLSRETIRNIRQNLFWAFGYNVIGIPIAAGLLVPLGGPSLHPMLAASAMAFSSVSVVLNSLRLRNFSIFQGPN